ncbi:MAG: hypothetical protein EBY17_31640, partial [Acidobacteriia bacterium]|nr:hypothetical protein [Terriglobia bacterium]
ELFAGAAASPQAAVRPAEASAAPRRRAAAAATEDPEPAAPSAFPAGKMTPWQQYAQALLGSGEFLYVD